MISARKNDHIDIVAKATFKNSKCSSRKMSLLVDAVRNMPVRKAMFFLALEKRAGSVDLLNLLKSAIVQVNDSYDIKNVVISTAIVNKGSLKFPKYLFKARGRVAKMNKTSSHVSVVLSYIKKGE